MENIMTSNEISNAIMYANAQYEVVQHLISFGAKNVLNGNGDINYWIRKLDLTIDNMFSHFDDDRRNKMKGLAATMLVIEMAILECEEEGI